MKRILSLLLALTLCFALLPLSASAKTKACSCGTIPRVIVSGMGTSTLYYDFGTAEQREAPIPAMDGLKEQLLPMSRCIITAAACLDWSKGVLIAEGCEIGL